MSNTTIDPDQFNLCRRAVLHVLDAIAYDPRKFWLLGPGTESYALLTAAAAAIHGKPVEEIKAGYRPAPERWESYLAEKAANERLLQHCFDEGITAPEED